jgi:hypothetical protein
MSKFNYCHKLIFKSDVSHAWINLHRCVEAFARTTGESYSSIFTRFEKKFNFERKQQNKWPDLEKIKQVANCLKTERDFFLQQLSQLTDERRIEKAKGKRISTNQEFLEILKKQEEYKHLKLRAFEWRKGDL